MGGVSVENTVKVIKKQRLKWWHVIVVGSLAFVMFVCSVILFFVWNVSNIGSIEVASFTQQENALVGEFYNIPDELDVMFLKHRQYSGGGFVATYSQAYFYLDKNDLQNYCASLTDGGKWSQNSDNEGRLNTVNNNVYKAISCFDGDAIHDEYTNEQVIIYQSLNKDDEKLLVYICQQGKVDGLVADRAGVDEYRNSNNYDYEI